MSRIIHCLSLMTLLLACSASLASEPYLEQSRVAYIENVLRAFSKTNLQSVKNTQAYIDVVDRNNCQSSLSDLKVECLLSFAKNNCKSVGINASRIDCELVSDIIIVNKLSEKTFVNRSERYRLLKNTKKDYRSVMKDRLQRKYAGLVTQFTLTNQSACETKDFRCIAQGLDSFCLKYTNLHSLSWQYCMGASLWFIGTSKAEQ